MSAVFFAQLKELTVRVAKLEQELKSRPLCACIEVDGGGSVAWDIAGCPVHDHPVVSPAPFKPVLTMPKKTA